MAEDLSIDPSRSGSIIPANRKQLNGSLREKRWASTLVGGGGRADRDTAYYLGSYGSEFQY